MWLGYKFIFMSAKSCCVCFITALPIISNFDQLRMAYLLFVSWRVILHPEWRVDNSVINISFINDIASQFWRNQAKSWESVAGYFLMLDPPDWDLNVVNPTPILTRPGWTTQLVCVFNLLSQPCQLKGMMITRNIWFWRRNEAIWKCELLELTQSDDSHYAVRSSLGGWLFISHVCSNIVIVQISLKCYTSVGSLLVSDYTLTAQLLSYRSSFN